MHHSEAVMRKILIVLLSVSFSNVAQEPDYFDMSLEELLAINLEGDTVKSIDLKAKPISGNTFQYSNLSLPRSIEVMTDDSINSRGITNVIEVIENMTGILSGESPSEPYSFSFRGFSRDSVNVVYDGLSMGIATLNTRPINTFSIKQVEIIKGPAELTMGQGGASGTVNIMTKKAALTNHHTRELLVSAGEFGTRSTNLGIAGPFTDKLAYRFDLSRNSSDGWSDDTGSGATDVSASLLWQVSQSLGILFSLNKHVDNLPAYWGTPFVPVDVAKVPIFDVVENERNWVIDEKVRYKNYNVADNEISSDSIWNRMDVTWKGKSDMSVKATLYSFNADRRWQNAENYLYNPDINLVERDRLLVEHDRDNWGAQFEVAVDHELLGKVSATSMTLAQHNIKFDRNVGFNLDSPTLYWDAVELHDPQSGLFGEVDWRSDALDQKIRSAVINNISRISESLTLHTQMKYESISFDRRYINWDGTIRNRSTIDKVFNEYSMSIGLNYLLDENESIYLHYALSHDPIFGDHRYTYDIANLKPSDISQLEAGYKRLLNEGKSELTAAIYKLNKSVNTQPTAVPAFFKSEIASYGLELSLNTQLTSNLSLGINAAFTDSEFGRYYDPDIGLSVDGNGPVNVPDKMLNVRLAYQFDSIPLEFGTISNYVSARWADTQNTVILNSYYVHRLFLAYHGQNYYAGLHVNNVTDEIYGPWSDIYYPNQIILGHPINIKLTFKVNF